MNRRTMALIASTIVTIVAMVAAGCGPDLGSDLSLGTASDGQRAAGGASLGADSPTGIPLVAPAPPVGAEELPIGAVTATAVSEAKASGSSSAAGEGSPTVALPAQAGQASATMIRSGHAVVEVDSVPLAVTRVRQLAQQVGALVANASVQTGKEQQRTASLELRVPAERFDALVSGLAPIGKLQSVNVTAQDVGEELVDLTARLANARRLEARLIELLASRTGRLSDVLAVERELARVRETIERYEGRLRYLQARVAVSSLTVQVQEPPPVVAAHPGQNVIAEAFVEAWRRFVLIVAGLIASLGVVVPVALLASVALVVRRRLFARRLPSPPASPSAA